ncbi:MAG: O-antigen ligase family protein [Bacteroidales bacterium]|nr:O-antigen ligase family protein [Bacteroidales bacterium]
MKLVLKSNPLSGLTWLQTVEYVLLTLGLALLPISFHATIYAAYSAAIVATVRMITSRTPLRVALASRSRLALWGLVAMVALWIAYATSLLYSSNFEDGVLRVVRMAPLIVFGLYFMLADPVIYTRERIRFTMWVCTAALLAVFAVSLAIMLFKMIVNGTPYSSLTSDRFYNLHHAYMAYFLLGAIGFVYSETVRLWQKSTSSTRVAMVVAMVCLAAFIVIVNSRAGILGLAIVVIMALAHLALCRRQWLTAAIVALAVAAAAAGTLAVLPKSELRLQNTTLKSDNGDKLDARVGIYSTAIEAVTEQPLGYGVGDYIDELCEYYARYDYDYYAKEQMNSHNQYIDTTLATGFIGLLLLLASLALFGIDAIRRRDVTAVFFIVITAESFLFEAMLNRQWGVLFFSIVYGLLAASPDSKKITQFKKN